MNQLIAKAHEARKMAYAPYSNFTVGAALLGVSGTVYLGCNIENAAYSPTNCAERTAFFKAVSQGERQFTAIAIVGGAKNETATQPCPPCGVCRQVMMEFCNPNTFQIILEDGKGGMTEGTLAQFLPQGFGPNNLD